MTRGEETEEVGIGDMKRGKEEKKSGGGKEERRRRGGEKRMRGGFEVRVRR